MTTTNNCIAVPVSFHLIFDMMTTGYKFSKDFVCLDGLPPGAKFVKSFFDHWRYPNTVIFVFEHESFAPVKEGDLIPIKAITFSEIKNA